MPNLDQAIPSAPGHTIPRVAWLLTACVGVVGANSLALGPIAPEIARDFGATVPAVMTASSAFGLGTATSALFLARYIDKVGARRMLRLSLAVMAVALAASAAAPLVFLLVAAQFAAGLAAGVALPAIYATAAAVAPPGRESGTIGVVLTGWTLSMVAGVSLAAVLADLVHWRAVHASVAALAIAAVAALAVVGGRDRPSPIPARSPLEALAIPGVIPLLVACGAFMTGFYGVYGYLGDHLHHGLGRPLSANGLAALAYGLGFGGAALLDGAIDRMGARRAMPLAYLAVASVLVAMAAMSGSYWAMIGLMVAWGLTNHFGLNVLVMRLGAIDPSRRGAIMGLNSAVTYLAVFVGTSGFGPVYAGFGFVAVAGLAAALMLVAIAAARRG